MILDEATYVATFGWVPAAESRRHPRPSPSLNVVVTGRDAPRGADRMADTVTEMRKVKHAFDRDPARKGIEY